MKPHEIVDRLITLWQATTVPREEQPRLRAAYSDELHTAAAAFGIRTQDQCEALARTLHLLIREAAAARTAAHHEHATRRGPR